MRSRTYVSEVVKVRASLQQMTLLQSAIFDTDEMAIAIQAWKDKQVATFEPLSVVTGV